VINILVNSFTVKLLGKGLMNGRMEIIILATSTKIIKLEKASLLFQNSNQKKHVEDDLVTF
jgi:hypothetical protein